MFQIEAYRGRDMPIGAMSAQDQSRRFDDVPITSALPLITDLRRKYRHVRNVPTTDIRFDLH
jgi:hypothetical protein